MAYLKSMIAGLVAALVVFILPPFFILTFGSHFYGQHLQEGEAIGWDPIAALRSPWTWAVLVVAFAGAFYWELRRSR